MEPSDAKMMARLASGEALSLNGLMSRCWEKVTAFLFRMTGHFDAAAGLAHETIVKLYRARDRYRPAAKFPTYAPWKARHPVVSLDGEDGANALAEMADTGQSPEQAAVSAP